MTSDYLELNLTTEDWKEAVKASALHLERKNKYARRSAREESRPRDYDEALRVATDSLVCELSLQKSYISHRPWNAYSEDTKSADIGEIYEVRSYNCMTNLEIQKHWKNLGYDMPNIRKDNFSFDFICTKGHVEIYAKDDPNRHCTFVVIASAIRAYVIGGISIRRAHKVQQHWAKNPQYKKTGKDEDKLFWIPVSELYSFIDCPWFWDQSEQIQIGR